VAERYAYDAYGKQAVRSDLGLVLGKTAVGCERGFTGYAADNQTGLLHARAREYNPQQGRFISRDSWGYVDGLSMYSAYFAPNLLDPSGHKKKCSECRDEYKAGREEAINEASKRREAAHKEFKEDLDDATKMYNAALKAATGVRDANLNAAAGVYAGCCAGAAVGALACGVWYPACLAAFLAACTANYVSDRNKANAQFQLDKTTAWNDMKRDMKAAEDRYDAKRKDIENDYKAKMAALEAELNACLADCCP
jgi:RHS repeat-associated protein